ncbi:VOC family protein [Bradyrhizobium sp.]|uniref:VOC family protein n=1 Tax=Bradyrhizobium sp. TaxID=376 RepID=UPI003C47B5EA
MEGLPRAQIRRLASFGLTTPDAHLLSEFYQHTLDFRLLGSERRSGPDFERLMGVDGGASAIRLGLGDEVVELLQFDRPGRPYPEGAASSDLSFQHLAIVVADIHLAYQRLASGRGWTAISTDGPQQLPAASGGVTAFKFRDPDGHPLELLAFPNGQMPTHWQARSRGELFLGIDHSAISVADSATSIAFYEALGLRVSARSLNVGLQQDQLDAVRAAQVEVTALDPEQATPHLELLCYRSVIRSQTAIVRSQDVAATRLMFEADQPASEGAVAPQRSIDPDGHRLVLLASTSHSPTHANTGFSPRFVQPE